MSLRDIEYKEDYRSGYDRLVEDLYQPSLREAELYWRAVGYQQADSTHDGCVHLESVDLTLRCCSPYR